MSGAVLVSKHLKVDHRVMNSLRKPKVPVVQAQHLCTLAATRPRSPPYSAGKPVGVSFSKP
jgi:hypothetical protein